MTAGEVRALIQRVRDCDGQYWLDVLVLCDEAEALLAPPKTPEDRRQYMRVWRAGRKLKAQTSP